MAQYTRADAEHITKLPRTKIHHWVRMGIIEPRERGTTGPGRGMRFSKVDLMQLVMTDRLQEKFKLGTIGILTIWKCLAKGIAQGEKFADFWENPRYGEDLEVLFIQRRKGALVEAFMESVEKEVPLPQELMSLVSGDFEYTQIIALGTLKRKVHKSLKFI